MQFSVEFDAFYTINSDIITGSYKQKMTKWMNISLTNNINTSVFIIVGKFNGSTVKLC